MTPTEHDFVDQMGLMFEENGGPRMMGRIFGFLLICDPAVQSLPSLCAALGSSKGATSIVARQLVTAGLVERVHVRGERAIAYRVRSGAWFDLMRARFQGIGVMRRLAERGLDSMGAAPPERRARLEGFRDFYAYMEREMEPLFARYGTEEETR